MTHDDALPTSSGGDTDAGDAAAAAVDDDPRHPGALGRRLRTPAVGRLAGLAMRFGDGIGRPLAVRRALGVPARVRAAVGGESVRAPQWWRPSDRPADPAEAPVGVGQASRASSAASAAPGQAAAAGAPLPARGLPRVVRAVQKDSPRVPGGTSAAAVPQTVPMRLPKEVTAAGAMLTSLDQRRRSAGPPRRADGPGGPSGKTPGTGTTPDVTRRSTSAGSPDRAVRRAGARAAASGGGASGGAATVVGRGAAPVPAGGGAPLLAAGGAYVRRRRAAAQAAHAAAAVSGSMEATVARAAGRSDATRAGVGGAAHAAGATGSSGAVLARTAAAARAAGLVHPADGPSRADAAPGPATTAAGGRTPGAAAPVGVGRPAAASMSVHRPVVGAVTGLPTWSTTAPAGTATDARLRPSAAPLRRALGAPVRLRVPGAGAGAGSHASPVRPAVASVPTAQATAPAGATVTTPAAARAAVTASPAAARPAGATAPASSTAPASAPAPASSAAPAPIGPRSVPSAVPADRASAAGRAGTGGAPASGPAPTQGAPAVGASARAGAAGQQTVGGLPAGERAVASTSAGPAGAGAAPAAGTSSARPGLATPGGDGAAAAEVRRSTASLGPGAVAASSGASSLVAGHPAAAPAAAAEPDLSRAVPGAADPAVGAATTVGHDRPTTREVEGPGVRRRRRPAVRRWSGLPVVADALPVRRAAGRTPLPAASVGRAVRPVGPVMPAVAGRAGAAAEVEVRSSWSGTAASRPGGVAASAPRAAGGEQASLLLRSAVSTGTGTTRPAGPLPTVARAHPSGGPAAADARLARAPRYATVRRSLDGTEEVDPTWQAGAGRRTRRGALVGSAPVLGSHRAAAGATLLPGAVRLPATSAPSRPVLGLHRGAGAPVELPDVTGAAGRAVLPPRAAPGPRTGAHGPGTAGAAPDAASAAVAAALAARLGAAPDTARGSAAGPSAGVPARVAALLAAESAGLFEGSGPAGAAAPATGLPGAGTPSGSPWAAAPRPGGLPAPFASPGPGSSSTFEGAAMTVAPISRSWADPSEPTTAALSPEVLDELVDRVVERIEDRVVEELERRGRRGTPGVF